MKNKTVQDLNHWFAKYKESWTRCNDLLQEGFNNLDSDYSREADILFERYLEKNYDIV